MSLQLQTYPVATANGPRAVLVACPTEPIVVGEDRIELMRTRSNELSEVDHMVLRHVAAQPPGRLRAFVFRGTSEDGEGYWRMAEEMSPEQRGELAYLMFRGQLAINRACAERGMVENFYIDWPSDLIDCFSSACTRIADDLRKPARVEDRAGSLARFDLWLMERHSFLAQVPLHHLVENILPRRIERLESRLQLLEKLMTEAGLRAPTLSPR